MELDKNSSNEKIKELEVINENLKKQINELEKKINNEENRNNLLNEKIEELQKLLNEKEKNLKEDKKLLKDSNEELDTPQDNSKNINNEKIIKLMEEIKEKENEIKELKSKLPFELSKNENLMTIIFKSFDQNIHYSLICKNTQIFNQVEILLYKIYPEYKETENFFIVNGNKINRFKSLEENKIKNSDIILVNRITDI